MGTDAQNKTGSLSRSESGRGSSYTTSDEVKRERRVQDTSYCSEPLGAASHSEEQDSGELIGGEVKGYASCSAMIYLSQTREDVEWATGPGSLELARKIWMEY